MFIPDHFIGKLVAIQLREPVYVLGYGAHVQLRGVEHLVPQPIQELMVTREEAKRLQTEGLQVPTRHAMTNFLPVVLLKSYGMGSIVVELLDSGTVIEKVIDLELVVGLDLVTGHNQPMPQLVDKTSKIVLP